MRKIFRVAERWWQFSRCEDSARVQWAERMTHGEADNWITGGKIYSVRTRDVKSRVAEALRLGAQSLWQARNYFGDLYRR